MQIKPWPIRSACMRIGVAGILLLMQLKPVMAVCRGD
jgi:hypothetical protein